MRFGQEAEVLAWSMVFLFQPISCVFYPMDVLPVWLKPVAWANRLRMSLKGCAACSASRPAG